MSGEATRWFSDSYPTWNGPPKRVELVELLGGHSQLQDRKPALGGRTRAGWKDAVTAVQHMLPPLSVKSGAEHALHLVGGAELR